MCRKVLENQFAERIRVEDHSSGHQEVVLKHHQTDICNIEQHYQCKVASRIEDHAVEHMQREAELETTNQEAEQQRKLLHEALQLEKENMIIKLTQEQKKLEHSHTVEMGALMERNLQLKSELEEIVSSAQNKETEFRHELGDLRNRLQENMKENDTLLAQTENKATKLELLLRQARDDLAQERAKFKNHLTELERQHTETLSFVEKQQQEQSDLFTEQKELRGKIMEMDHHPYQAVEYVHNERLEVQGTVDDPERKVKNSISIQEQEVQRATLLGKKDKLALKFQQVESHAKEAIRCETMSIQIVKDLSLPNLPIKFVSEPQDPSSDNFIDHNMMAKRSKGFNVLGENSPIAQHKELKRQFSLQEEYMGDFENSELINAQVLKIIRGESASCSGPNNNTDESEKVENDCFTDADTSNTEEPDEPYSYEPLWVDGAERAESIIKDSTGFPFDNLSITSTDKISFATYHEFVDGSAGTRSFTEDPKSLELCERSTDASNEVVAFRKINVEAEDVMRSKYAEMCNSTYSEIADIDPVNNTQHEGTQNIELHSGTFSKDTMEVADEKVPRCSSEEFNPVGVLVNNGTVCISTELVQHNSNRARGFQDITTNMTDSGLLIAKVTQAEFSYHEDQKQGLEMQEKIEEDTSVNDNSTTSSQHQVLALECGPLQKKEQDETASGAALCAIEILELQAIAVQFKYQSSLLELLQEQYRSTLEQNLSLQDQVVYLKQRNDQLELLLDPNRGKVLTSQKGMEKRQDLKMDLTAMAGHAKESDIKALELAELQAQYEKCICENVQLTEQKMKLERRVQQLESKMHIVQEFQKHQSSLLMPIKSMRKENARLSTAVHDLEHQGKVLSTMQEEGESVSVDSSDDSFQDHSCQLGMKIAKLQEAVFQLPHCGNQNPCVPSAVTYLQKKSHRINKMIQEHRYHKISICSWLTRREILPSHPKPAGLLLLFLLAALCK